MLAADETRIDLVAEAFARVIDAKSPYTYRHSEGVAAIAVDIGAALGLPPAELRELRRAALLHDIGKLGVPNTILDKPTRLDEAEWAVMKRHPAHTYEVLSRIERFRPLAAVAAAHHERIDGAGYHRGLTGAELGPPARAIAVADVAEALSADRPYRAGMPWDQVLAIMSRMAGPGLCEACFDALRSGPPRDQGTAAPAGVTT